MPYISPADQVNCDVTQGEYERATIPGQLNYQITKLCLEYITEMGRCYDNYNAVIGALECTKLELYRRMVAPYEDKKIEMNGDVYP